MKQNVIALLGLSGVGKSTVLHRIAGQIVFQHLQASALIKEARQTTQGELISTDSLRHANIDDNQQLLIEGFAKALDKEARLVVLDGHSVIDTTHGLIAIGPSVFSACRTSQIVFLAEKPSEIANRRRGDVSRNRPARSVDELQAHQNAALINALNICLEIGITMTVLTSEQIENLRDIMRFSAGEDIDPCAPW